MSKRIRCQCGRVYDPVKRAVCPHCGATNVIAAETPPVAPNEPLKTPEIERIPAPPPPRPSAPTFVSPRLIALGAGLILLLVLIVALSRCGGKQKPVAPETPTPQPTATSTPTPTIASPTPTPTPTSPPLQPTLTPPPPTAPPVVPPPPPPRLTSGLAAQLANAAPGATIRIPPGNYPGGLVANRPVHLVGTKGQVVIDGAGREGLAVRARGVTAQDIQFRNSGTSELPAVNVYEGADLQLQDCQVPSNSVVALSAAGQSAVKARDSSFTARNGTALRLTKSAQGDFAQVSFSDSGIGLWLAQGARAELHSCAFQRDGGNGGGAIMVLNNPGTTLLADDCQFANNHGGINSAGASLTITNSTFRRTAWSRLTITRHRSSPCATSPAARSAIAFSRRTCRASRHATAATSRWRNASSRTAVRAACAM